MRAGNNAAELSTARAQGYYTIGRAAEISGVTAKMIRHYEAIGLIPKASRTGGDYRMYSPSDLHALRFVRRARSLGFAVNEIAELLGLWRNRQRSSAQVKRIALQHVAELDRRIQELQSIRATLAGLAKHCPGDTRPECPILSDLEGLPDPESLGGAR